MILPLGDEPNPRGVPVVTYGLILVNCAAYLFVTLPLSFMRPDMSDPVVLEYVRAVLETMSRPLSQRGFQAIAGGLTQYDLFVFQWGFRPAAPQVLDLFTAMFLHGGEAWHDWNEKMVPIFIEKQNADGSWKAEGNRAKKEGTHITTCWAALSLSVYYRYLPMYNGFRRMNLGKKPTAKRDIKSTPRINLTPKTLPEKK